MPSCNPTHCIICERDLGDPEGDRYSIVSVGYRDSDEQMVGRMCEECVKKLQSKNLMHDH